MCHSCLTMYARRNILENGSLAHVFFRCHNRQFFLKNVEVRNYLILLWAKYKKRYDVRINEFIIMDNHAHLLVCADSVEGLGHFMRTVNSQLARFINKLEKRDSQAIRERYKSPLITNERYLLQTMQYIWLNRFKVNKSNPAYDPHCSVSWRLNSDVISYLFKEEKEQALVAKLLDFYPHFESKFGEFRKFIRDLLNAALSSCMQFVDTIFENGHTIGDAIDVHFRSQVILAFRREHVPVSPPSW
jgi:REP element-mobilizing transposase RayT